MNKKLKIILTSTIIILSLLILYLLIAFTNPKIECGNGVYQTWEKGLIDGPIYYYDSDNILLAKCPSDGFGASEECNNLNKQCKN